MVCFFFSEVYHACFIISPSSVPSSAFSEAPCVNVCCLDWSKVQAEEEVKGPEQTQNKTLPGVLCCLTQALFREQYSTQKHIFWCPFKKQGYTRPAIHFFVFIIISTINCSIWCACFLCSLSVSWRLYLSLFQKTVTPHFFCEWSRKLKSIDISYSGVHDGLPGTAGGQRAGNPIIRNSNKLLHNSIGLIRFTCDTVSVIRSTVVLNLKEFDKNLLFLGK